MGFKKFVVDRMSYRALEERYFYRVFDKKLIEAMKDQHLGERCFILGNGPSLNKANLNLLKDEFTFGVNSIFLKEDFRVSYYVVEDRHVAADNSADIYAYKPKLSKFIPRDYSNLVRKDDLTVSYNLNIGYGLESSPNFRVPRFSADASLRLYSLQTVTNICLQLAFYLGFSEVYLIGVDFNYVIPTSAIRKEGGVLVSTEADQNHFSKNCFGPGKKWFDPHLDRAEVGYSLVDLVYKSVGRKVYNATDGGKLEVFERVDYESLF